MLVRSEGYRKFFLFDSLFSVCSLRTYSTTGEPTPFSIVVASTAIMTPHTHTTHTHTHTHTHTTLYINEDLANLHVLHYKYMCEFTSELYKLSL